MRNMYYIIKRETSIPFDTSHVQIVLGDFIYDVVKGPKNTGLDSISDFIVDGDVLVKSDPRLEKQMKPKIESALDIKLQELLLG
ncbi:MAG: hypothetical protein J7L15_05990 [Clostridiales bacterium]|nr:hypothetical protein [Clostridiales bacterium]